LRTSLTHPHQPHQQKRYSCSLRARRYPKRTGHTARSGISRPSSGSCAIVSKPSKPHNHVSSRRGEGHARAAPHPGADHQPHRSAASSFEEVDLDRRHSFRNDTRRPPRQRTRPARWRSTGLTSSPSLPHVQSPTVTTPAKSPPWGTERAGAGRRRVVLRLLPLTCGVGDRRGRGGRARAGTTHEPRRMRPRRRAGDGRCACHHGRLGHAPRRRRGRLVLRASGTRAIRPAAAGHRRHLGDGPARLRPRHPGHLLLEPSRATATSTARPPPRPSSTSALSAREGASTEETVAHDQRDEELRRYKLSHIGADDEDGYHRVAYPAAGRRRCPLREASMSLTLDHPQVLCPP
jgi:hypothetical protein